ncbi:cation:proton antiporter [Candidatus Woesearchaeota archaeon]|nr:cation:proton antiporter [Candidatus Woesearchaeota archaeon]
MQNVFFEIGIVIISATVFAFIARLLRQPFIPLYIFAGILLGPVFHIIQNSDIILFMSEAGIAFLLFIIGLEIDIRRLKDVGIVSSLGGLIQMFSVFTFSFIIALLIGFKHIESIYIALVIAFSSTMIVVKLLSDKKQIDTLHGRIIIGILLMQDIIAIFVLSILTTLGSFSFMTLVYSVLSGLFVFLIAYLAAKYAFPHIFTFAAKSQELLFITAVSASFLFSLLFNIMGFSIAVGAFVAGVALANLPYNIEIVGKVKSLRDFFSVVFFVSLGMELTLNSIGGMWPHFLIFLLLAVIFKPLVILFICSFFGYKIRTSFETSISLAQISEFSLIIVAQGLLMGHVSQEIFSITVLLAIVTIALTSYYMKFEESIYSRLKKYIGIFDRINKEKTYSLEYQASMKYKYVLVGYNRIGYSVVNMFRRARKKFLVIDFNPETIRMLINEKVPCLYGDIGDTEIIERLDFKGIRVIVSTIPTVKDSLLLIRKAKESNKKIVLILTASQIDEALKYYDAGADYVLIPHLIGGDHVSLMIENMGSIKQILEHRLRHIEELKKRHSLHMSHPAHGPS